MKSIKYLLLGIGLLFASEAEAQLSVNVNIGTPPLWGPVGYSNVQYYYLPDVEAYYDVRSSNFIYFSGGKWIHRKQLPNHYRNYDLYNGYKVVMSDYRGKTPYVYFKDHKSKYKKGYRGTYQKTNGNKPEKGNNKSKGKSNKKNH
jgi:hypothetical protein